jgi:hypothetical protein
MRWQEKCHMIWGCSDRNNHVIKPTPSERAIFPNDLLSLSHCW